MDYKFISVKEMFDRYKVINVPYYQREYVWGTKNDGRNLYKFIDDIFSQYKAGDDKDYFIGTLAFCSAQVNDVIDGQQRITSLVLILSRLAELKCSTTIKGEHAKLLVPEAGKFVINEENYLTEELKKYLGLHNSFNVQGNSANISKTIERIDNQINSAWSGYQESWYDGLYNYIMKRVMFIKLEYNNISDSLKYFLNINSLSIQLTQAEIFYSILSQSIRLGRTAYNIFSIKNKLKELGNYKGIDKDIDGYKAYDEKNEKGVDNVIYLFLNSFYQNDKNIQSLNESGIGKWMSFFMNDVFNDAILAKEFTEKFAQFLKDFEIIYKHFTNMSVSLPPESSLYISHVLLQYENCFDILKMMSELFRIRHNYITGETDLYKIGTSNIDIDELNEIAKRLNLTLIWNYMRSSNKRLDGFIGNITKDGANYNKSINDILGDIDYDKIFNLTYRRDPVSSAKINDDSRIIKVIFACQEAFLDKTADSTKDMGEYLQNILSPNAFSVEHIYSINEYKDSSRRSLWQSKKGKFSIDSDFDIERFKFDNLSLLDTPNNSSAGDDVILDKLKKYKAARKIFGSNWEYLIQSLADDSEYYRNASIQALGLPDRKIVDIDQNTWELSQNNRNFNIKLLKMAIEEIANK
ncbi:MAG: DUF262 domain-containing protein [Bacilli bacterium]|nr:DUF262 domain-containing protein [Bacilli bacterium]